ncbi:MAG: hypothetical protein FWE45_05345 [Firmicutes bacterium]|nr:hypothetical protein [Bacillota bacterium]
MRGCKLTVAIITIIQAVFAIAGAVFTLVVGIIFVAGTNQDATGWEALGNALGALLGAFMIGASVVALPFGIIYLILGIKFTSRKPNRGIAITLIVLNALTVFGVFTFEPAGITTGLFGIAMIVLTSIYLSKLGKYQREQASLPPAEQEHNFDPVTGKPLKKVRT